MLDSVPMDSSSDTLPPPLVAAIVDRSVTLRTSPTKRGPAPAQPLSGKAQQRLIRQAIAQAELEAEERQALLITPEELRILHESVKSVKAEFHPLDGLSWDTPQAREMLQQWHAEQAARQRALQRVSPSPSSPSAELEEQEDLPGGIPLRRTKASCALSLPNASSPSNITSISLSATPAPAKSTPVSAAASPSGEQHDGDEDEDEEDTIRLPRCADSRRSSTASTVSSASTIVPGGRDRDARTPLPSMLASLVAADTDKENASPFPWPSPPCAAQRPALPKSHSAPAGLAAFAAGDEQEQEAGPSSRPMRPLPPSRIPVRSKSLSLAAKPCGSWPSSRASTHTTGPQASASTSASTALRQRVPYTLTARIVRDGPGPGPSAHLEEPDHPHAPAKRSFAAAGLSVSPSRRRPQPQPPHAAAPAAGPSRAASGSGSARAASGSSSSSRAAAPGRAGGAGGEGGGGGGPRRRASASQNKQNKFRIISAPPPRTIPTRPPSPPRPSPPAHAPFSSESAPPPPAPAASARVVSDPAPGRPAPAPAATSDTRPRPQAVAVAVAHPQPAPVPPPPRRVTPLRVGGRPGDSEDASPLRGLIMSASSQTLAWDAESRTGTGPSSPARGAGSLRRLRDAYADVERDADSPSPSPSPTRRRVGVRAVSGGVPMRRT
ncbi:hypothetical protein OH77DRAFT_1593303 [Trametes cingulata]|nr:hypothetical protein OH77DRAFT_1593303 [Trametes cingulata]